MVCSKNVKHKRMVSQHRNPRLFLLGGSLEYQKTPNKLASLDNVLEQVKFTYNNFLLSTCHIIKSFYKASPFLSFFFVLLSDHRTNYGIIAIN